jgi:opacity protein-like surface antigen
MSLGKISTLCLLSATVLLCWEIYGDAPGEDLSVEQHSTEEVGCGCTSSAEETTSSTSDLMAELPVATTSSMTDSPSALPPPMPPKNQKHSLIEAKAGYFFFTESTLRNVYDHAGIDVQLSYTYAVWENLQIYGSAEYAYKAGRSLNGEQKTYFQSWPLSLGLQYRFSFSSIYQPYVTLGPRYFFVHIKNDSSYVNRHLHNNGLGGFVNAGCLVQLNSNFAFDVFGEYSYKRLHFHSSPPNVQGHTTQVGGLVFGGGLGYKF